MPPGMAALQEVVDYRPKKPGSVEEVAGTVWLMTQGKLYFGRYTPDGNNTAHMQLWQQVNKVDQSVREGAIDFAGSLKPDGSWAKNSLFNNREFKNSVDDTRQRDLMSRHYVLAQEDTEQSRATLKAKFGDVPCSDAELKQAQKCFASGKYFVVKR